MPSFSFRHSLDAASNTHSSDISKTHFLSTPFDLWASPGVASVPHFTRGFSCSFWLSLSSSSAPPLSDRSILSVFGIIDITFKNTNQFDF